MNRKIKGDAPSNSVLPWSMTSGEHGEYVRPLPPEHLARWWGPRDFTLPTCEMDFRPGGAYRHCMRWSTEGRDFWSLGVYREIVVPERIVFMRAANPASMTFAKQGDKTKLTMRMLFPSAAECEKVKKFGAIEGGNQTLDRFEERLAKMG